MKVPVILAADCYVGGKLRTRGETVEVAEEIAADFGTKLEAAKVDSAETKPVRRSKKKQ